MVVAGAIGLTIGLLAGYYGGWLDNAFMRLVDAFLAVPSILISLVILETNRARTHYSYISNRCYELDDVCACHSQ